MYLYGTYNNKQFPFCRSSVFRLVNPIYTTIEMTRPKKKRKQKHTKPVTDIINELVDDIITPFPMFKFYNKKVSNPQNGMYKLIKEPVKQKIHWQNMDFYGINVKNKKTILRFMRKYVQALEQITPAPTLKTFHFTREQFGVTFKVYKVIQMLEVAIAYASDMFGADAAFTELYDKIQENESISWVITRLEMPLYYVPDLAYANAYAVRDYIKKNVPQLYKEQKTLLQKEHFTIEEEAQVRAFIS